MATTADAVAQAEWRRTEAQETARLGLTLLFAGPVLFVAGWYLLGEAMWEWLRR